MAGGPLGAGRAPGTSPVPHATSSAAATQKSRTIKRLISSDMSDMGAPIAWSALATGTPIYSSDNDEIGKVADIIADRQKDIFSGLTFRPGLLESTIFIPASAVESLSDKAVKLSLSRTEAEALEPYEG